MNGKKLTAMLIIGPLVFGIISISLFLTLTKAVILDINCYSVDSKKAVYVGTYERIEVYESGKLVRKFSPMTSSDYHFTILPNDTLLLSTTTTVYSMDLEGNITGEWQKSETDLDELVPTRHNKIFSLDGTRYDLKQKWGWTYIETDKGDVVFQISTLSFIVKMAQSIAIVLFILGVLFILKDRFKEL